MSILTGFTKILKSPFKAAIALSLIFHFSLLAFFVTTPTIQIKKEKDTILEIKLEEPEEKEQPPNITREQTLTIKAPATQEAPSAPTAEEWAFASTYTLKNSKGYRHTWSKQVRSMMGTAVEGPDQGQVRFRIEIAPNGNVTSVETLWKTSDRAEELARKAIYSMPPPPPTPTGKPLIFEKTISFSPFATDDTPIYSDDCLPDPPVFNNPFAWDGKSPQQIKTTKPPKKMSPEELAECLKQLPQDSIDGVIAHDQRLLDRWSSNKLNQQK